MSVTVSERCCRARSGIVLLLLLLVRRAGVERHRTGVQRTRRRGMGVGKGGDSG